MKSLNLFSVALLAVSSSAFAATINWTAVDGQLRSESGEYLPNGSQVFVGTFNTTGAFKLNLLGTTAFDSYAEVAPFFTSFGSVVTSVAEETPFGGYFETSSTSVSTGSQIFIWAFNSATAQAATEWAVIGGSWFVPADPVPGVISIDVGVAGRVIHYGTNSNIGGFGGEGAGTDVKTAKFASAVPEPSTFAALAGLVAVGFAATRRRRQA